MSIFNLFEKKKIGLVLSGGGVRGFFHMGVITALQELNIEISEISGTSMGALVGAIYAANPKVDFTKVAKELNFFKITQMLASHFDKSPTSKLENALRGYIPVENFENFKIPMSFNAVDINQNKEIVFRTGSVFPEIISSISIPGVFPPVQYQDELLIDGGVLNNIPISNLKNSNKIIVSDVSGPIKTITPKTKNLDVLYTCVAQIQQNLSLRDPQTQKIIKRNDTVFLSLDDQDIFILDFRKVNFKKLIDQGYNTTMKNRNRLLALK